jgi:hypothetical protein
MKLPFLAISALLGTALVQSQASADGSIAVARSADDQRFSLGVSYNAPNRAEADAEALRQCDSSEADSGAAKRETCQLVATFDNQCVAVAQDMQDGGTAWAYGYDSNQSLADERAMNLCRNQAGARAGNCELTIQHCDGSGDK